jgi:hypothetical protein
VLISITPSAFMPDILLSHFSGSYPLSTITTGVCDSLGGALAFALSPSFGKWSDMYGRKRVIMALSLVSFLPVVELTRSLPRCLPVCSYPFLNLWFYLSVRCFAKVSAYGILFSCISDVAPVEKRARLYGQTMGLSMVREQAHQCRVLEQIPQTHSPFCSPLMQSAMLIGPSISLALDAEWAFRVTALFAVAVIFYVQFLLPETLWVGLRRMQSDTDRLATTTESASDPTSLNGISTSIDTTGHAGPMLAADNTLRTSLLSQPQHVSAAQPLNSPPSSSTSRAAAANGSRAQRESSTHLAAANEAGHHQDSTTEYIRVSGSDDVSSSTFSPPIPSLNPCHALKAAWRSPLYRTIALIIFFSQLTDNGVHESAMFFLKHQLSFTKNDNSILLLAMGGWSIVVLFVIMPMMLRRWDEKVVLITALVMDQVHQLMYMSVKSQKQPRETR